MRRLHPWPLPSRPSIPLSFSFSRLLSHSPRTPQTPLKHYPRADALGKSDATIQLPRRIDITSHYGHPHTVIHIYIYIHIHIYTYIHTSTSTYKLESPFRGRVRPGSTDLAFGFRKGSKAAPVNIAGCTSVKKKKNLINSW